MDELDSSELGTLEYWEERYNNEIKNFNEHGDTGEIWFGEDIVDRLVTWITTNISKSQSIVDIGCGNGHILIELAQMGYKNLTGLDYSEKGINLATAISQRHDFDIKFQVCDILEGLPETYEVIHDKGTYDAISLSENSIESCEKYLGSVAKALGNGCFVITSCNWTESELEKRFQETFILYETIPTPQFRFGGKVGNVVSICVFKKKL
ncbi:EEF1A lysine methyltransferase 2 [Euwallacea similis]|uniref:EEF1A lysine methyltransferase 2 n=1 Tax=Euwallacea similis TaxID=1736056 RepID=UPI00344C7B01